MRIVPLTAMLLGLMLVSGCSHPDRVGDGPVAPARAALPPLPERWRAVADAAGPVADGWVAAFGDPRLAALVAEAQEKNSDLQAAAAQVQRAAALARQARSGLRPAVQAVGLGSRSHIEIDDIEIGGQAGLPVPSSIEYDSTSFLGLAQASWEIDLWGRISDGWYAALENEAAARADYFAARQSIAAGVARAYLVSIEASRQVGLAEEAVDTLEHLHRLVGLQVREGVAMDGDLALIRANLEQAREALARAQGARREAIRALELLVGRYPAAEFASGIDLPPMPTPPPAGLPSTLLERRPDLVAAERRVAAALHAEDQASKARLPRLSLTGLAGAVSDALENIFDPTATLFSIGGNVAAPIYQGGALAAGENIADAELRAAIAQYAGAALAAFEEVETALDSGVVLRRRRDAAVIRVREIEEALRIEDLRYRVGESSLLDVLQIRQQAIAARSDLATIERMEREQFVTLNLALGGSWNAPEADPPEISEKDGDANP